MYNVYEVRCVGTKKRYVGVTVDTVDRFARHYQAIKYCFELCRVSHRGIGAYRAFKNISDNWYKEVSKILVKQKIKDCRKAISIVIVAQLNTVTEAADKEQQLISLYTSKNRSFNHHKSPSYTRSLARLKNPVI